MTKSKLDEYMAILNTRSDSVNKEEPIDLRNAKLSTYEEDENDEDEGSEEDTNEQEEEPKEPDEEKAVKVEPEEPNEVTVEPAQESKEDGDTVEEDDKEIEPEFDITDAFAIIASAVDADNPEPDFESVKFAMGYIEGKLNEKLNAMDPDYAEDVKLLGIKLNNYKVEYDKASNMERKLYMIAMGETRLYRHIEKYGYNERCLGDIDGIAEDWYGFIEDRTGFDITENKDIGAILYALQELKEEMPAPKTATKKKKRRK